MKPPPGRTAFYELYGLGNVFLYAGVTGNPSTRFNQHACDKGWWPEVARRDVTWYATRVEAEAAEVEAIRTRSPKYNIAIPDEDGRYTTGVGRPTWTPGTEHVEILDQLRGFVDAHHDAETELWQTIRKAKELRVPANVLVETTGITRPTLYRRLNGGREKS